MPLRALDKRSRFWYNRGMPNTEPTSLQRGGRRPRAGRPPELEAQLAEAKRLAAQLRLAIRGGLYKLANEYESLLDVALDLAKKGDTRVLLHLLDLPSKLGISLQDEPSSTVAGKIAKGLSVNAENVQINVEVEKE